MEQVAKCISRICGITEPIENMVKVSKLTGRAGRRGYYCQDCANHLRTGGRDPRIGAALAEATAQREALRRPL